MSLRCYYKKPVKQAVPKYALLDMIKEMYRKKNEGKQDPLPLTNADFLQATELCGRRMPTKATFAKWLGGSLREACKRAGVPYEVRK